MKKQNINRQCMEKILSHLTKLICLTEFGDSKELSRYIDMSTSVSAQLLAIDEQENNNVIETKGENTKIMAECIRFVEQLITEEAQKSSAPAETTVEETKED